MSDERSRLRIRAGTDEDLELEARIQTAVEPELPVSADELRIWRRAVRAPPYFQRSLIAEAPGAGPVGVGWISHHIRSYHPDRYSVALAVDPAHEHQGVGRFLYERIERTAVERGARLLWANVDAERSRNVRFFERSGFVERRRSWIWRLDLRSPAPGAVAQVAERSRNPSIVFTTLAAEGPDRPDVRQRYYRGFMAASRDVPRMAEFTPSSFEQFLVESFDRPTFRPESIFLARQGEEYVGISTLDPIAPLPDSLSVGFTGTTREHRGQGIATELKRRAIEYARDHGYRFLITTNDAHNRAIVSINETLGFRRIRTQIYGEKRLTPSS
jgi:mycothiol synthase